MTSNINNHIARLRRHHLIASRSHDTIALQDLSNILRIFVELSEKITNEENRFSETSFISGCPNKRLKSVCRGVEHLVCFLLPSVTTYAMDSLNLAFFGNVESVMLNATIFRKVKDNGLQFKAVILIGKEFDFDGQFEILEPRIRKLNFSQWLGSEIARYRFKDQDGKCVEDKISRGMIIKRVANTMDGSHASINSQEEFTNKYDSHVRFIRYMSVQNLSLPYLILLNTAERILAAYDDSA